MCLAVSCKKDPEPAKEPLTTNKTSITLQGRSGHIDSFTIQYPGNWTITKTPTTAGWLNVSSTSGAGNITIYVSTAQINTLGTPRSAVVTVMPDGDYSRKVDVTVIQSHLSTTTSSVVWSKLFGGSYYDIFKVIQPTPEGGYIAAGYVESVNGDVTGNHGGSDVWVVKMDATGGVIWKTTSTSSNGDVPPGNHGLYDAWVFTFKN
jgi:Putative binding domain, N-terminal